MVLRLSRRAFPFIATAFADSGYAGETPAQATSIRIEIVRKPPDQVGFAVHPRRWVVERFFAWISRNRRLWKDPRGDADFSSSVPLHSIRHAPHPPLGTVFMIYGTDSKALHRGRARIEQTMGKLKRFKRVALRCEKTDESYSSFVVLALSLILIKSVQMA